MFSVFVCLFEMKSAFASKLLLDVGAKNYLTNHLLRQLNTMNSVLVTEYCIWQLLSEGDHLGAYERGQLTRHLWSLSQNGYRQIHCGAMCRSPHMIYTCQMRPKQGNNCSLAFGVYLYIFAPRGLGVMEENPYGIEQTFVKTR